MVKENLSVIWDKDKNTINKKKHGISFEEAKEVFLKNNLISIGFNSIVQGEERWQCLGKVGNNIIIVIYCMVESEKVIRIISARKTTQFEEMENCKHKVRKNEVLGHAAKSNVRGWFGKDGYRDKVKKDKKWR